MHMENWVVPRFIRPLQSDFCKGFFYAQTRAEEVCRLGGA